MRLFALVSGLAVLGATPCLALTLSSAPPNRDAAPHLRASESTGPALRDTFAGSSRPGMSTGYYSSGFSNGATVYSNSTSYAFGSVQTTITNGRDPRFMDRRETPAPLGLVPRR